MIIPVEYKLVIKCDPIDPFFEGGILEKPKAVIADERRHQSEGVLVAKSDMCFEGWKCDLPKVGDRVMFSKWQGDFHVEDGVEYRVMNDKDVIAILSRG